MEMKKRPGRLHYKCRQCGRLDTYTVTPDVPGHLAMCVLGDLTKLYQLHNCGDGEWGVADLVGGVEVR